MKFGVRAEASFFMKISVLTESNKIAYPYVKEKSVDFWGL